jgi:hypothetical protein
MSSSRAESARHAADALSRADLRGHRAVVGFDGFVDSIIDVVDTRRSMAPHDYARIATIEQYAARCAAAAGKSTNLELVVHEERFGGNGPLMAGGLAQIGLPTTYIGAVAAPGRPGELHPLYADLQARCEASGGRVLPIAPPAHTHALEFDDGKIMLGDPRNVQGVTWRLLHGDGAAEHVATHLRGASLLAVVNWVMMAGVQGILEGLARDVLPTLGSGPRVFIDLCDPAKRTDADIEAVLAALAAINRHAPVTLGLNQSESERIDRVCRAGAYPGGRSAPPDAPGEVFAQASQRLREKTGLDGIAIHPRHGAGGATASGEVAWFDGPVVKRPRLSTGAGDHFNSGFALGQVLGLPLVQALALGCGVSGAYVRDAQSPTRERLIEFLRDLPAPE